MPNTYLKEEELNGQKIYKTYVAISELKLDPNNPRDIPEEKLNDLMDFLSKYGAFKPLLVDIRPEKEGQLIGGNMRLQAMKRLGYTEAWVELRDPITDAQAFEMGTIDNMEFGHYVEYKLQAVLKQYEGEIDLSKLGVHLGKIPTFEELLRQMKKGTTEDEPPAKTETFVSQPETVYQLGRHRLMCGDATKATDISKLMNGQLADMVFTDPPYNVNYEGKTADALKIENDSFKNAAEFYQFLLDSYISMASVMKSGATIYVCHADSERVNFTSAFQSAGFKLAQVIIWEKQHFVMGRQDYQWQHEPILYGWKDGGGHYFVGDRRQTTIWKVDRPMASLEHPTMKPIALIAMALQNSSKGGDIVLDTFAGSGSTLIACEQTDRICYALELDPRYCDVIRKRYAKFIGKEQEWEQLTPAVDIPNIPEDRTDNPLQTVPAEAGN